MPFPGPCHSRLCNMNFQISFFAPSRFLGEDPRFTRTPHTAQHTPHTTHTHTHTHTHTNTLTQILSHKHPRAYPSPQTQAHAHKICRQIRNCHFQPLNPETRCTPIPTSSTLCRRCRGIPHRFMSIHIDSSVSLEHRLRAW
jgi:hypothetical protein